MDVIGGDCASCRRHAVNLLFVDDGRPLRFSGRFFSRPKKITKGAHRILVLNPSPYGELNSPAAAQRKGAPLRRLGSPSFGWAVRIAAFHKVPHLRLLAAHLFPTRVDLDIGDVAIKTTLRDAGRQRRRTDRDAKNASKYRQGKEPVVTRRSQVQ